MEDVRAALYEALELPTKHAKLVAEASLGRRRRLRKGGRPEGEGERKRDFMTAGGV